MKLLLDQGLPRSAAKLLKDRGIDTIQQISELLKRNGQIRFVSEVKAVFLNKYE